MGKHFCIPDAASAQAMSHFAMQLTRKDVALILALEEPCSDDGKQPKIVHIFCHCPCSDGSESDENARSISIVSEQAGFGPSMDRLPPIGNGPKTLLELHRDGACFGPRDEYFVPPYSFEIHCTYGSWKVKEISVSHYYGGQGDMFYQETPPAFVNICGCANFEPGLYLGATIDRERGGKRLCTFARERTPFGICRQMCTVFGNVTVREMGKGDSMGSSVSLKAVRDVGAVYGVIGDVLGRPVVSEMHNLRRRGSDPSGHTAPVGHDGFFEVHMAIVTATLGKRLFVNEGCALETAFVRYVNREAAAPSPRLDTDSNTVKIHVRDWVLLFADLARRIEREWETLYANCGRKISECYPEYADCAAAGEIEPGGDSTVTVTSKGSVILRFSWDTPVAWGIALEEKLMRASRVFCRLTRMLC